MSRRSAIILRVWTMADPRHARLRAARARCGFASAAAAAATFGWNHNTYASNENGRAPLSCRRARTYAAAFAVDLAWLLDGLGAMRRPLGPAAGPVVGTVGHLANGQIYLWDRLEGGAHGPDGRGEHDMLVLLVEGEALRSVAAGSLIYFEARRRPPSVGLLGHLAVLATRDEVTRLGRLVRRGEAFHPQLMDGVEDLAAFVSWASPITAIIPPVHGTGLRKPCAT